MRLFYNIKHYWRKRLFMKIYFSILNHPQTDPGDTFRIATEHFHDIMKLLEHSGKA